MQISRHWRLNANRYRLEGVRYENGAVSLQERPVLPNGRDIQQTNETQIVSEQSAEKKALTAA